MSTVPVIAYIRTAATTQNEPPEIMQRDLILTACRKAGCEVFDFFEDIGVGGDTDFKTRPAGRKLLDWLQDHGPAIVMVAAFDRINRNSVDAMSAVLWISAEGGTVRAVDGAGPDFTDPESRYLIAMANEAAIKRLKGDTSIPTFPPRRWDGGR
jgi:DNA invertase Pin-like site-specific DNA recombinase